MLLFPFFEQGNRGLAICCDRAITTTTTKLPLSTHFFSVSIAQIGASDFMELAIGYFIV